MAVAVGWGLPTLGHSLHGPLLSAGVALVVVSAGISWRGWRVAPHAWKVLSVIAALLLSTAFTFGATTGSVVVDGRVQLSTSSKARAAKLIDQIQADLTLIANFDILLTYSSADAGSHVDEYPVAHDRLLGVVDKYRNMAVPDTFVAVVDNVKSTAHNEASAMEAMYSYLQQPDQKFIDDRDTFRSNAATAYTQAGKELQIAAVKAGVPLSTKVHE